MRRDEVEALERSDRRPPSRCGARAPARARRRRSATTRKWSADCACCTKPRVPVRVTWSPSRVAERPAPPSLSPAGRRRPRWRRRRRPRSPGARGLHPVGAVGRDGTGDDVHRDERTRLHVPAQRVGDDGRVEHARAAHAATSQRLRYEHGEPPQIRRPAKPLQVVARRIPVELARPGQAEARSPRTGPWSRGRAPGPPSGRAACAGIPLVTSSDTVPSITDTGEMSTRARTRSRANPAPRRGRPHRHHHPEPPDRRNALNGGLIAALDAAVKQVAADPEVKVVILTGAAPARRPRAGSAPAATPSVTAATTPGWSSAVPPRRPHRRPRPATTPMPRCSCT